MASINYKHTNFTDALTSIFCGANRLPSRDEVCGTADQLLRIFPWFVGAVDVPIAVDSVLNRIVYSLSMYEAYQALNEANKAYMRGAAA